MKTYTLINYDVWGDSRDGPYTVNAAHYTGIEIQLTENFTDKELRKKLLDCGFCTRGILNAKILIEGEPDYTLYVSLTALKYGGSKPFCELRKV